MNAPAVVLLRSAREDDPYETAFRNAGFSVSSVPVLRFEQVGQEALREDLSHPSRYAGLVLTSPRAADALDDALVWLPAQGGEWESKPAFAVGPRTAEVLRGLGFSPQGEETGSADALAALISRQSFDKPLLFLAGNRRRDTLPEQLRAAGIAFEERCVYETHLRTDLHFDTMPDVFVFFSPSGVEAFEKAGLSIGDEIRCAAIGPTTARALRQAGWPPDAIAEQPTPGALVDAVRDVAG